MSNASLLTDWLQSGVTLWAEGDKLRFRAPQGALSPRVREQLAQHKDEIIRLLGERKKHAICSFAQQRLWFLDQLEPGNPAYNVPSAVRLVGNLGVAALERSLTEIIRRHEVLRTTFTAVDGFPVQVISPTSPGQGTACLAVVDLQTVAGPERETLVQQLIVEEAQRSFDLSRGPLIRTTLLRLAAEEHVLLLTMHHIVSDIWSSQVLIREMAALYHAFSTGQPSPLPELPLQYADMAAWQREWLRGKVLEGQLAYWKRRLDGATSAALELPTDHPRPPVQTFRGAHQCFVLPECLSKALQALSRQEGATLFMTLLAAFQALLSRYTGQEDILVGTPSANRNRTEFEGLIGFFVNTLVLRTDLSGNPTFRELVGRVRAAAVEAYAHQDLPFEMLVEELQPERNLSHSPLFQVMFMWQNAQGATGSTIELPGLTSTALEVDTRTAKFDLSLFMEETARGLTGIVEYSTDLFEDATILRLISHFETLLESIAANPDRRLADLTLLTEPECRQVLTEWNDTHRDYPRERCLHELLETLAQQTPDAVAVVCGDEQATYRELHARANRLAHHLVRLGVESEVLVGVCVERSVAMMQALLAVLKAGGGYVPLDPDYPPERLAYILADSGATVVIADQHHAAELAAPGRHVVCLENLDLEQEEAAPLAGRVSPQHVAYVIYTSGSTGKPKGVVIEHRSLVNVLMALQRRLGLGPADVWLAVTTLAFDIAGLEVYLPLLCGARVAVASRETAADGEQLAAELERRHGTVLQATPATWRLLVETGWRGSPRLRVLCGGEALPRELANMLCECGQAVENLYGPTETTIWSTAARVQCGTMPVDIGRPLDNTRIYILGRDMQPVPVGVSGELYIGGEGLARGYRGRPDLTAERFVPDPFSAERGARLYRTGDWARYRPNGEIECLGRMDDQVKVRGYRIELGEIEAVLGQHPAVRQSVVRLREDTPGDKRLVAYVVPQAGQVIAVDELRRALKDQLPVYMIPAAFVVVDALPLTPNGKVDRKALPRPERSGLDGAAVAPRDVWELGLVRLWEQVLGLHPIGVTQSFFDLGGHSLLAVRLMARIQQDFGRSLPLATLFQGPTVESMALVLRRQGGTGQPTGPLVRLQTGDARKRPLFLVHPVGGSVLCYADLVRSSPDQPIYGLQARGLEDGHAPLTRVQMMARHYLARVRAVQPEGPYRLGGWSLGGVVAFEMARQLGIQGQPVELLALIDSHAPSGRRSSKPDDTTLLLGFALSLGLPLAQTKAELEQLQSQESDEQLAHVLERAKQAGRVPPDLPWALARRWWSVYRRNLQAVGRYIPCPLEGSIVLFRASEPYEGQALVDDSAWAALAAGGLTMHPLPGHHDAILHEPNVRILAEQLERHLQVVETAVALSGSPTRGPREGSSFRAPHLP